MKSLLRCILSCGFFAGTSFLSADPVLLPNPVNILEQSPLSGSWFGCRPCKGSCGVDLSAQSVFDLLGNTAGGAATGGTCSGLLNLGLAADLNKVMGWEGATFKNTWLWIYGKDLSTKCIGNSLTASGIAGYPSFRCYELWLQQNLLHDVISLRGGMIPIDTEFMVSDTAGLFVNSTFGPPALFTMNVPNGGPTYPMATPGLRMALQPVSWLTLRSAFAQGNPFPQQDNKYGFDWNFGQAGGLLNINEAEAEWCKDASAKGLPGYAKAGFWFQTGQGPQGGEEQFHFGSPNSSAYNNGCYGIIDQKLYIVREKATASTEKDLGSGKNPVDSQGSACTCFPKGLSSFAGIGFSPDQSSIVGFYAEMGLTYTGLIPTRDADKLGVAFGYAQMGCQCRQSYEENGAPGCGFESVAELTYSMRLAPAIAIQPDLQYILHPGGTQQYGNALVVGFRAVVDF
jgi:porin